MRRFWTLLALGVVLLTAEGESAKKIPRWWLKVAEKQGPNACVVEEVPGTAKEFWTECRYWLKRKICGKKTRIRFECCEGFDQVDGENGCTLVKPLKNVLETAESMGATRWAAYIRKSGLQNEFESAGAYTLFAPTNEAFDVMKSSLRSQVESYRGNPNNPVIYYHVVPSKLRSEDFDGDQSVETRHQGHNIRINKYSNGMTTINCALLVRKDQEATNGIVHIIDGVLDPSVGISTNVADMILNDDRFEVMAEILEKSGYVNVLRTLQDSITILAPSDEAFQKLPDSRREKIINDREARLALLQNHVIPHVICESAITGQHRVRTMSNNKLTFNCDIDGAYVEDTKLRGNFNLGKNGIIHMIDDVLLPDRAKNLVELAESRQLETFVDFVKKSGLEETLSHTGDYTFFVPNENAWLEMPPETMELARRDPEYAGLMLRFHGAYGRHLTNAITDNQGIMSLDEENPVRLQVWRRAMGVEDAKITESDLEAQNGVIHIINKVIFPSNQSVEDILTSIHGYSFNSFLEGLNRVKTESPSTLHLGPGENVFYTFFVPTDRAFEGLYQEELKRIKSNSEEVRRFVTNHIAVNMFPETSFEPGLIYSIEGLESKFNVRKDPYGRLKVNDTDVLSSHMSANGVIHVIDKVFVPSERRTYSKVEEKIEIKITHPHPGRSTWSIRNSTRKTVNNTHHRRVTVTEEYGRDYDQVLPAYPQDGGRFNYVGHPYGNDVPGHDSQPPLPLSASSASFVTQNASTDGGVIRPNPVAIGRGSNNIHGVSTTAGVRRTFYNHPSRSSTYLKKSSRTFSLPLSKTRVPSMGLDGKLHSDLLSAYAFTDEDRDFADGTEFSEARGIPSEKVIAIEQAKILRRQWRRKRRHLKKRNKFRKGRKRGRRNFRRRRVLKDKE